MKTPAIHSTRPTSKEEDFDFLSEQVFYESELHLATSEIRPNSTRYLPTVIISRMCHFLQTGS